MNTLLGGEEVGDDVDNGVREGREEGFEELDGEITIEEAWITLGKMKNGKAEGEVSEAIEIFKNLTGD